ncbi:hypothetical protein [Streptomyces sp. NPDC088727]|uniref:hypothetical protein n=1 Tax=Streptomyces sp. NPDC088727 TaxID=3365875 RepID=UPI0037F661FA
MIDPGKIPTFTGNLENLETHAASLKTTATGIRDTGKDVHTAFQALDPVYDAPEQGELLDSTIPVRDRADAFAEKLESVSGALAGFASTARPLVTRMNQLREDAAKFVADNKDDDDWQQDQDKIDENARLVDEVGTTWVAFQGIERDAANQITSLVGGTHFVVDDGSHKAGMYGFKESDVKDADETPWGTVDEREYTGLRAAWEWTKDNVGGALKGFFVDGVWGALKGLGSMFNVFDWDNFKTTWSGIGDVFGGISAYLLTPYDWALDKMFGPVDHSDTDRQKAALRNFGKSLVAWDEWDKDPSRAFGTVLFNGLTIGSGSLLKLGRAGKLAKGAEAVTALGKAGALVDPMSYLGKAAGVTKLKVGDLMESLKAGRAGIDDMARNVPTGTTPHPGEVPTTPGLEYVDHNGNTRVVGDDAVIRDEHGNVVPDTKPVREPHKNDLTGTHETAPVKEKVLEGSGGPGHVENSASGPSGGGLPEHSGSHPGGHGDGPETTDGGNDAGGPPPGGGGDGPGSGFGKPEREPAVTLERNRTGQQPSGPMAPDQEAGVTAALNAAKVPPVDQGRMLTQLKKSEYGAAVAKYISSGRFADIPMYKEPEGLLFQVKQNSMIPAVHQAMEHAFELQSKGINNIEFELKLPKEQLDLDVLVRVDGRIEYGAQLKEVDSVAGIKSAVKKIAEKQLGGSGVNVKAAILDIKGLRSELTDREIQAVQRAADRTNASFELKFDDGSITVYPTNSFKR